MQLLVSVADGQEAHAACRGGADVIDAKDPRRGALGPVRPDVLRAIGATVGSARPLSAALGDATTGRAIARAAERASRLGLEFVKVGFAGVANEWRARGLAAAARGGAGAGTALVLVAYADWSDAGALTPEAVVAVAAAVGARGVLLDTASKGAPLFVRMCPDAVARWVAGAHAAGLFAALAGGLSGSDFAAARDRGADLVGVRGAACVGGRTGRVSRGRVAALAALARATPSSLAPALV